MRTHIELRAVELAAGYGPARSTIGWESGFNDLTLGSKEDGLQLHLLGTKQDFHDLLDRIREALDA